MPLPHGHGRTGGPGQTSPTSVRLSRCCTPVPGDEGKAALLADAGWTESPQGGRLVRRLLSPVVVITPAALASRALFRVLGLENAGQLVLALEDRRAVAEPPEQMAARQEL